LSTGILVVLLAGVLVSQTLMAGATHQPADKVVAAGSKIEAFAPGTNVQLLTATLKTAKPTDLMLHVTLECSILTKLNTAGSDQPGATETDSASGNVQVWIEVQTGTVTRIVPINAASSPPQDGSDPNSGTKAADSATFCNRTYARTVTDREDDDDGIDGERDYIRTKNANAFNWLLLNAGTGLHTIRVMADLSATPGDGSAANCTENTLTGDTCARAFVGNRTLIVEPAKLANDATI
jgi:hypothetical protein